MTYFSRFCIYLVDSISKPYLPRCTKTNFFSIIHSLFFSVLCLPVLNLPSLEVEILLGCTNRMVSLNYYDYKGDNFDKKYVD